MPTVLLVIQKLIKVSIANGRIFRGMFYIPFGMLLANKKVPKKYYAFVFIVGMIGNIAIDSSTLSLIMAALSAIGLFGIVKSINLPDATIYPFMRKMSTVIYFIHMYVWSFYYKIIYGEKTYGMDSFLATALICLVISGIYVGIIRYKKQPYAIK